MKRSARVSPLLLAIAFLGACDAETSLQLTPEVLPAGVCPEPHQNPGGAALSGDWGTVTPISNGVEYEINEGYTARICAKGGPGYSILTVPGPASGTVLTPENEGGNIPDLSHWSVTDITGGGTTSSTTTPTTSTTSAEDTTTAPDGGATTTIDDGTTVTQGEITTTTGAGDTTTTEDGDTTTTTIADVTITTDPGATTTSEEGTPVTEGEGPGDPTTTVEVGAGGVTTTPDGEGEGTLDPTQETSTTGDEVAGASDETLPRTGTGQMSLSGLAALSLVAGAILLLLVRRRSRED
jgi:LPXTG-motif cell wall-anchored protein